MSDQKISNMDQYRFRRLEKVPYFELYDDFELLRIKVLMENSYTDQELHDFRLLCKYFMCNGHSKSFRYSCKRLFNKLFPE